MTHAIHRFTSAIFGWIPDLSGIPPRRRVTMGVAVSLLLHVLIILILAILFGGQSERRDSPKLRNRAIELVIEPPTQPELEPLMPFTLAKPDKPFLDSRGLDIAQEAAKNAIFQSDENMKAASELPATGDSPLPSQEGRDRPFNAFSTQKSLLGSATPTPFPPEEEVPPLDAAPPAPPAPSVPMMPPVAQQQPPEPSPPEMEEKTDVKPPSPEPPIKPEETVPTVKPQILMKPRNPAMAAKIIPPPLETPQPVQPMATPQPEQQAMLTTPAPRVQPSKSGYQPEQEQNRIEGMITNRGKKSVDAVATPLAKYRKQVNDAIGSRWYFYVKDPQRMSLIAAGSARISFFIDSGGQVVGIKLESNTSNDSFAELCASAVRDAREQIKDLKFPADDVLPLKDGRLECSILFTFYNL